MSDREWHKAENLIGSFFTGQGNMTDVYTVRRGESPELPYIQVQIDNESNTMTIHEDYQILCVILPKDEYPEYYL